MSPSTKSQQLRIRLDQLDASLLAPKATDRVTPVALKATAGDDRVHGESY